MSGERRGLTSASNAEADSLCAGRHLAQRDLPEQSSKDSDHGDLVHKAFQGLPVELDTDQLDTVERGKEIEKRVFDAWVNPNDSLKEAREMRFWSYGTDLEPRHSGQADAVWVNGKRALIEDLKSLFGDIPDAEKNMQLRDLAALVWEEAGAEEVTVFINQPKVTSKPQVVTYLLDDIKRAHAEMLERVKRSNDPESPRTPGAVQCKYCRAWATCPEAQAQASHVPAMIDQSGKLLTRDQKVLLYDQCVWIKKKADSYLKRFQAEVKENPADWPEFKIEESKGDRMIKDLKKAFSATEDLISEAELLEFSKVKLSAYEDAFSRKYAALKNTSIKDGRIEFSKRLQDVIERGKTSETLVRV